MRKWAFVVGALLFTACALVQINDPDPIGWIALYGVVAAVCIANLKWRLPRIIWLFTATIAFIWAVLLIPGARAAEFSMDHEVPRELGGLALVIVWSLFGYVQGLGAAVASAGAKARTAQTK